jgi:hypothetical protein
LKPVLPETKQKFTNFASKFDPQGGENKIKMTLELAASITNCCLVNISFIELKLECNNRNIFVSSVVVLHVA